MAIHFMRRIFAIGAGLLSGAISIGVLFGHQAVEAGMKFN
jgi:hypothetical protein